MRPQKQLSRDDLTDCAALVANIGGSIIQHAGLLNDGLSAPRGNTLPPDDELNDHTLISIGWMWAAPRNATNEGRTL